MSDEALKVTDLRVSYGGIAAVKGISLEVQRGEIVTLIGANGAGKTSTLKAIVGLVPIASGSVTVFGEPLRAVPTHKIVSRGVALVPEGRAIFTTPALPPPAPDDDLFHVSTRRGKQFNTLIYAEVDPLNGAARDAVLINADDAAERRLMQGDRVELVNHLGRYTGRVFLAPIAPGNLQIHWPEGNHLLPRDGREPASDTPDYNTRVRLEKVAS